LKKEFFFFFFFFFFSFFCLFFLFFLDFIPFGEVLGKNYIILVVAPKPSLDSFERVLKSGFDRIIEFNAKKNQFW